MVVFPILNGYFFLSNSVTHTHTQTIPTYLIPIPRLLMSLDCRVLPIKAGVAQARISIKFVYNLLG